MERTVNTKFWYVNQNNSGGSFDFNEEWGITHFLVVEALDKNHAISILENIVDSYPNRGYDCPCCGFRWNLYIYEEEGSNEPEVYEMPVADYVKKESLMWMDSGKEVCVHYLDGRKEWF